MADGVDKKQVRKELAAAARDGITGFLRTIRGTHYLQGAELQDIDDRAFMVRLPPRHAGGGPVYFSVTVKEQQ